MNKWKYVSASQFKTYALCKRKWHIERFSGLPRPEATASQKLGTEVHDLLERYLKYGTTFPDTKPGRIAKSGVSLLPAPGEGVVEGKITVQSIEPPLMGFIDLYIGGDIPEVIDHKTLKDWKWAKTEEELASDLQMIPYAVHALNKTGAKQVRITHFQYITTGSPEARQVSTILDAKHVYEEWNKLKELAVEMKATSLVEKAQEVEETLSACGAYGGCPYQEMCGVMKPRENPFENIGFVSTNQEKKVTEKNRLQELLDKRRNDEMKKETGREPEGEDDSSAFSGMGIVPPDAPKAKPSKITESDYAKAGLALVELLEGQDSITQKEVGQAVSGMFGLKRLRWNHVEAICDTHEGLEAVESNRTVVKASQAEAAGILPPSLAKPEDVAPAAPVQKEENGHAGIILYIDCFPMKGGSPALLEDILAPYVKEVAKNHSIPTPQMLDYAKGKAEVAALFCLNFPKSGEIIVSSKSPYWASVEPYLVGAAVQVIRRFM